MEVRSSGPPQESCCRPGGATLRPTVAAPGAKFEIFGNGRICRGGEFTVRQVSVGAQPSDLRFAVDFVMECGTPVDRVPHRIATVPIDGRFRGCDPDGRSSLAPLRDAAQSRRRDGPAGAADRPHDDHATQRWLDGSNESALAPDLASVGHGLVGIDRHARPARRSGGRRQPHRSRDRDADGRKRRVEDHPGHRHAALFRDHHRALRVCRHRPRQSPRASPARCRSPAGRSTTSRSRA